MHWNFKKDRPYFVLDPEGDGITYFETVEERDKFADECIRAYLDDTWSEEVVNVIAGVVTHSAQQTDRKDRGSYWEPDCEYRCNYQMLPVVTLRVTNALEVGRECGREIDSWCPSA